MDKISQQINCTNQCIDVPVFIFKIYETDIWLGFVLFYFFLLMAYQTSWVI